jgi:two-component system, NarL family, nitrate/nitrite response regulator NarL
VEGGSTEGARVALLIPPAMLRDGLGRALRAMGMTVVFASGQPHLLLAALQQERPAVTVLDVSSLKEEGFRLIREVRQFFSDIPLLALLSAGEPGSVERCLEAGAAGYLDLDSAGCEAVHSALRALAQGERVFPALFLETFVKARSPAPNPASGLLNSLSAREKEVLTYLANGTENGIIAGKLKISERTVKAHVSSLYRKLHQGNRTQLALFARQLGVRPARPY